MSHSSHEILRLRKRCLVPGHDRSVPAGFFPGRWAVRLGKAEADVLTGGSRREFNDLAVGLGEGVDGLGLDLTEPNQEVLVRLSVFYL